MANRGVDEEVHRNTGKNMELRRDKGGGGRAGR